MNKYDEILLVRKLGLNTEDSILVKSLDELKTIYQFIGDLQAISLRTMHPVNSRIKTPHYPVIHYDEISKYLKIILEDGFWGIVAKVIDPKDSVLAGAIKKENNIYYIELANGPCTVRRVTHEGIIDHFYTYPNDVILDTRVLQIINEMMKIKFKNCIIELSYYSIPVGWKNENVIIWGISDDGTPLSKLEINAFKI